MRITNSLNEECNQLDYFRTSFRFDSCGLQPRDDRTERVIKTILEEDGWKDCSGKDVPPPDFICEKHGLMLEAMRVDDHERPGDRKGYVNPLRARESELIAEFEQQIEGFLPSLDDGVLLTVAGKTNLPFREDHNYDMYLSAFTRIVGKHARHADAYRTNHPGLELVFFVFDESSCYMESISPLPDGPRAGDVVRDRPHLWFFDEAFLDVIKHSGADYFLWYCRL